MASTLTFRNPHPDQLDRMVRVAPPLAWVVLVLLGSVLAGGLIWSVISTAPVKVGARGVLQGGGGLALVSAPDGGALHGLHVGVGDRVEVGLLLAEVAQPALDARIDTLRRRLDQTTSEHARLLAFQARERDLRGPADATRSEGLTRTAAALRAQETALLESLDNQRELRAAGHTTRDRVLALEADLAAVRQRIAENDDTRIALSVDAGERAVQAERARLEAEARIAVAASELAEAEVERAARSEVRAPISGRIVEVSATVGERVLPGTPLMRLASDTGAGLAAVLYVPPGEGKNVRPGMAVQVVPSTVSMAREGFILAEVVSVSEVPTTREAVQHTLKNEALVDGLLTEGPPFEVRVRLVPDATTASGFAWSSHLGAARAVEAGTVVAGHVVVDRRRLISLVFPQADAVLARLGFDP